MANSSNSAGLGVESSSSDPVVRELSELVWHLVALPDPAKSGSEGALILGRINQIVFDEALNAKDRGRRVGILMGRCMAAGHRVSNPNNRKDKP